MLRAWAATYPAMLRTLGNRRGGRTSPTASTGSPALDALTWGFWPPDCERTDVWCSAARLWSLSQDPGHHRRGSSCSQVCSVENTYEINIIFLIGYARLRLRQTRGDLEVTHGPHSRAAVRPSQRVVQGGHTLCRHQLAPRYPQFSGAVGSDFGKGKGCGAHLRTRCFYEIRCPAWGPLPASCAPNVLMMPPRGRVFNSRGKVFI